MTLKETTLRYKLFKNGIEVNPFIPELVYASGLTNAFNELSVTASATDEAMAIGDLGTIKVLELRVAPADVNKITVKINGSSKAYKVSPIYVISEAITAITASNSSTGAVNVRWRATYT